MSLLLVGDEVEVACAVASVSAMVVIVGYMRRGDIRGGGATRRRRQLMQGEQG